ncbi:MAG: hypothetical protein QOJ67_1570 [Acidimicrobiaceae bacterium]|jgi:uncharacterized RDD family membrane protein YckC
MAAYAYPGAVPYSDPTAVQGRRIGAFFIDVAVVIIFAVLTFLPLHSEESRSQAIREGKCHLVVSNFNDTGSTTSCDGFTFESNGTVYFADPAWFWVNFGFSFAYFAVLQGIIGATAGKLATGIRVVRTDGAIANIGWASIRWIFFFVDGPMTFGICGLVTFLVSKGHRRVGDMVAGTYVVAASAVGQPIVLPVAAAPVYVPQGGYYAPPGQGYPPPPGQGYPPPPGQSYPPPGQGYAPPGQATPPPGVVAPPASTAPPPSPGPVPAGPQWDTARGTYVQADPVTGVWHAWNTRTSQWEPVH